MKTAWVAVALLGAMAGGCKGGGDSDAVQVCQKAADRYVTCVEEILGPEAAAYASSPEKDGRGLCASDPMSVKMYRECLPKTDCKAFMNCMMEYAERTAP